MEETSACTDYENDRRARIVANAEDMFALLEKFRRVRTENFAHVHFGIEASYLIHEVDRILKAVRG